MDTSNDVEFTSKYVSEFNEAKFQILRLHNSWVLCNNHRRNGRIKELNLELDTIWDELSSKAGTKEEEYRDKIEGIDKKIVGTRDSVKYVLVRKKYCLLKLIQEEVGMGGKMKDALNDGMDE